MLWKFLISLTTLMTHFILASAHKAIFVIKILTNVAKKIVTKMLQNPPPFYYDVTILAAPKSVISPRPPPTFSDNVTEYDVFFFDSVPNFIFNISDSAWL